MIRRDPDEFRAEQAAKLQAKGATLLALNGLQGEQAQAASTVTTNLEVFPQPMALPVDLNVLSIDQLAEGIIEAKARTKLAFGNAAQHALTYGRLLTAARRKVEYGGWAGWLHSKCDISARQAARYMQLADLYESNPSSRTDLAEVSIQAAIKQLTSSTPRAAVAEQELAEVSAAASPEEQQANSGRQPADFSAPGGVTAVTLSPAPSPNYTPEGWLAKSAAERRRIIDAWGEAIIAGMSAEKIYAALPARAVADLERRFTFKITSALRRLATAGVGVKFARNVVAAGAALKLIQRILKTKGLEAFTSPPPSVLSETLTAALRQALSFAESSPNEAIAALNVINTRLNGVSRDLHDIVVIAESATAAAEAA